MRPRSAADGQERRSIRFDNEERQVGSTLHADREPPVGKGKILRGTASRKLRSEVRGQRSEVGGRRSEVGGRRSGAGGRGLAPVSALWDPALARLSRKLIAES